MKKILTTFLTLLLLTGLTTAAQGEDVQPEPGVITASSPLYGVDKAADQALLAVGAVDRGDIAFERASEVSQALEENETEAAEDAQNELNAVAQAATNESTQGLEKAEQVLKQVRERASEQSQMGLDEAIGNIEEAKGRKPSELPSGPDVAPR